VASVGLRRSARCSQEREAPRHKRPVDLLTFAITSSNVFARFFEIGYGS
jgi:hypothetical protein